MTVKELWTAILNQVGAEFVWQDDQLKINLMGNDPTDFYSLLRVNYTDFVTLVQYGTLTIYTY